MFIFRYLLDTQEFGFWLDLVACSRAVWAILVDTLVVLHSFLVALVTFSTAEAVWLAAAAGCTQNS